MERVLAIDLGGTKTAVGIVDSRGVILSKATAPTPLGDPMGAMDRIIALARGVLKEAMPVDAIGLALPGIVDRKRRILHRSPSSGWTDVPFPIMLENEFQLPVIADNDVNACSWAEYHFGSAGDYDSFFWLTVSTGIGGAIIVDGKVLDGTNAMAGEIGHLVVNPGGSLCGCGNHGCLEAEAAGPAWSRIASQLLDRYGLAFSAKENRLSYSDAADIAQKARMGDELSLQVVKQVGIMLARGIGAIINLLDPEAIILGGGVARSLDLLLPIIKAELPSLILSAGERKIEIRPSALGYDAALIGAGCLALYPY